MIPKIHPHFKLNGISLNHEALMAIAYSYVKEGEPWEKEIGDFLLNWLDNFEVLTVFTSGSTGTPKAYKLKKQHLLNSAVLTGEYFNLSSHTQVLGCLPLNYIAGKMMFVRALLLGWEIDIIEPSKTPLADIRKRYDFTAMTPLQLANSLDNAHKSKIILLGGGAVSDLLIDKLQGKHTKVFHSYGMTETASHVAIRQLYPVYDAYYTAVGENTSFDITEESTLIIKASDVTSQKLITNDIIDLINPKMFTLLGRADDVINSGGIKLQPQEIENKLAKHINSRYFIAGISDGELGQRVVLFIEGNEVISEEAFASLDGYEIPKKVYYLDSFIETHTGKIDKRKIVQQLESGI